MPLAGDIPFEASLSPLLDAAQEALGHRVGNRRSLIPPQGWEILERRLLRRLSSILELPLRSTFGLGRFLVREVAGDLQTPLSETFEAAMRSGGLKSVMKEYPVASRLAETVAANWVDATSELLDRLIHDRAAIAATMTRDGELGPLSELIDLSGDPHNGGRSVLGLRFASGAAVVYKCRDLAVELHWAKLLRWMEERGLPACPRPLRVLPRSGYGWVEYAETAPCADPAAVGRYYERAGALLAAAYALAVTDLHMENVVAAGEHPMLVDLELLMHPVTHPLDIPLPSAGAIVAANRVLSESVLATGLLPTWAKGKGGESIEIGGFGNGDPHRLNRPAGGVGHRNTPSLKAGVVPAKSHAEEIVRGFRRAYRLLVDRREELLARRGPLEAMRKVEVRCVFRTTGSYATTMKRLLLSHDCLQSEAAWTKGLEELVGQDSPLAVEEKRALDELDVPRFTVQADARLHPAYGAFALSGFELAVSRIERMCPEDLERQTAIVRSVLGAWHPRGTNPPRKRSPAGRAADTAAIQRWEEALARDVAGAAIRGDDRTASWIVRSEAPGGAVSLETSGFGLYGGGPGTALFLAAFGYVTGIDTHEQLVYEALEPARKALRESTPMLIRAIGIGGIAGAGSLGHALALISEWNGDRALRADADLAFELLDPERLERDDSFDVVAGAAGAILALLCRYERTGESWLLERARIAGRRLLEAARQPAEGQWAWPAFGAAPHSGFAHGASGIALALARLWKRTQEPELLEALAGALAFERSLFDPQRGIWTVAPRGTPKAGAWVRGGWCYGPPGILLARLGIAEALTDAGPTAELHEAVTDDARTAFSALLASGEAAGDSLCCGTAGRIEALGTAARAMEEPVAAERARQLATGLMSRIAVGDSPAGGVRGDGLDAGLFSGVTGIGYALLRLDQPDDVPSLLTLEPPASSRRAATKPQPAAAGGGT